MNKYAKIINIDSGLCDVAVGSDIQYFESLGFKLFDVCQSLFDGNWYLTEKTNISLENAKRLSNLKTTKLEINKTEREKKLSSGVLYKGILFDSDTDQKINLSSTYNSMNQEEQKKWFGMDGTSSIPCTKEDLKNIEALIKELTAYVWEEKNPYYINLITNCDSITELENLDITY